MIKVLRNVFITLLVLCALVAGICAWAWLDLHTKKSHPEDVSTLEVTRGERLDQILQALEDRGIINQVLPLRVYMKVKRAEPMVQAGFFNFPSPVSPLEVLEILRKGGGFGRLTIIEGWTRYEIADALTKFPNFGLGNRDDALKLLDNVALIKDLDPGAKNLEGYLFPDTYFVVADTDPRELVKDMVQRFRQVWNSGLAQRAKQAKRSVHSIVTEASIIETEAKLKSERPLIASVVENRIKAGMSLSMDSTVIYASKLAGKWKNDGKVYQSDIDRDSLYNTRKYRGLPPGPVSSPGLSSLQAAVSPTASTYIYYVRNPDRNDGAHNFYSSPKSFERGVAALRRWELNHPAARR
jgi:UPF0755 protein